MRDWQRKRSWRTSRNELGVSEEEWAVVQPRLDGGLPPWAPPTSFAQEETSSHWPWWRDDEGTPELVNNKEAKPEEIKAKLTALRAAKEQVRQELAKARQELFGRS